MRSLLAPRGPLHRNVTCPCMAARALQERRLDLAHSAAMLLDKHNLVKYDRRSGNLQATDLGRCGRRFWPGTLPLDASATQAAPAFCLWMKSQPFVAAGADAIPPGHRIA